MTWNGPGWVYRRGDGDLAHWLCRAEGTSKEDGSTLFIASTGDVDRAGDIIDQRTWKLASFRKNPVILHEHNSPVVGRGVAKVNKEAERLEIRVHWDASDLNPVALLMAHQHANGFRSAGSVGIIPGKVLSRLDLPEDDPRAQRDLPRWRAGMLFTHPQLLEFSTVAVPMNAAALQLSGWVNEADDDDERIRRFVSETMSKELRGFLLDAIQNDEGVNKAVKAAIWRTSHTPPIRIVEETESPSLSDWLHTAQEGTP